MERILPNLAHLSHGMLLCFFLLMSIELYKRKEKSRLLGLLWLEMVFWLLVELKDLVYLHEPWWHDPRVATINLTIDMWGIPATMLLMFEVLSPGWARPWRIVASVAPFMMFTLLFVATHATWVFYLTVASSLLVGATLAGPGVVGIEAVRSVLGGVLKGYTAARWHTPSDTSHTAHGGSKFRHVGRRRAAGCRTNSTSGSRRHGNSLPQQRVAGRIVEPR